MSDQVIISLIVDQAERGNPDADRVFVERFDADTHAKTENRDEADRFDRHEAEQILAAGYWWHLEPRIEAV